MSEIPESIESLIEGIRRGAGALSAYQLDVAIAETQARRDVSAVHKLPQTAERWNDLLIALADVRMMRAQVAREIEDMTGPAVLVRPLTAAELAAVEFDDTPQEPTC